MAPEVYPDFEEKRQRYSLTCCLGHADVSSLSGVDQWVTDSWCHASERR